MARSIMSLVGGLVLAISAVLPARATDVETQFLSILPSAGTCSVGVNLTDGSRYVIAGTFKVTVAANSAGNVLFQCRGELVEGTRPDRALRFDSDGAQFPEFTCYTGAPPPTIPFVLTTNWTLRIAPSGNALYNCHGNPSQPVSPL